MHEQSFRCAVSYILTQTDEASLQNFFPNAVVAENKVVITAVSHSGNEWPN
jgi:hypothetical protein